MKRLKFFDKDTIQWTANKQLNEFYKTLLSLRHNNPALRTGDVNSLTAFIHTDRDDVTLAWQRKLLEKEVLVFLNLSSHPTNITIAEEKISGIYTNVFDHSSIDLTKERLLALGPWNYLVMER